MKKFVLFLCLIFSKMNCIFAFEGAQNNMLIDCETLIGLKIKEIFLEYGLYVNSGRNEHKLCNILFLINKHIVFHIKDISNSFVDYFIAKYPESLSSDDECKENIRNAIGHYLDTKANVAICLATLKAFLIDRCLLSDVLEEIQKRTDNYHLHDYYVTTRIIPNTRSVFEMTSEYKKIKADWVLKACAKKGLIFFYLYRDYITNTTTGFVGLESPEIKKNYINIIDIVFTNIKKYAASHFENMIKERGLLNVADTVCNIIEANSRKYSVLNAVTIYFDDQINNFFNKYGVDSNNFVFSKSFKYLIQECMLYIFSKTYTNLLTNNNIYFNTINSFLSECEMDTEKDTFFIQ